MNDSNTVPKIIKCLPSNRMEALAELHINPTHKKEIDESPFFLMYLNSAANNIRDIAELDIKISSNGIENGLKEKFEKDKKVFYKLANFLWLFAVEDPARDYPDYDMYTIEIAKKIFQLRDYFAHLNKNGVDQLVVSYDFYTFVGGALCNEALSNSDFSGLKTSKLYKMKLFTKRDNKTKEYEFTRRGLIFFICLALYKDEANEFMQCLEGMELPKCSKGKGLDEPCGGSCKNEKGCKPAEARAFINLFTLFSVRRGRSVNFLEDDLNYMSFAEIVEYLNKVPSDAMTYLALKKENDFLKEKYDASEESEENKKFKYSLHKRQQNKFLSFSAGYIEDFNKLKSIKFKRLDISENEGRKKYFFGKEHDNRVHMNRHYEINHNAIHFEWIPTKHYGNIHIDSLRSNISAKAMKEIMYCLFKESNVVENAINEYFTDYHRFLETLLNTSDIDTIPFNEKLIKDACSIVNCKSKEELAHNNYEKLRNYFSDNIIRFFSQESIKPTDEELRSSLENKFRNLKNQALDFRVRLKKLNDWREELKKLREKDSEAKLPKPKCEVIELTNPPRSCNMSDAAMIHWVFRFFNLHLTNEQKFRQLPLGEQHRGVQDFEYQTVHALIGKYPLDPKGLDRHIQNYKKDLYRPFDNLKGEINKYIDELWKKQGCPKKINKYGKTRPDKPRVSLSMMAEGAANLYIKYIEEQIKNIKENHSPLEELIKLCKKFGVRLSLETDWVSLVKSVLHIDITKWNNAFDYDNKTNYISRSLADKGHVLPQIPFPADLPQRIALNLHKPEIKKYIIQKGNQSSFDFNKAFSEFDTKIQLRDYYDVAPLIDANYAIKPYEKQKNKIYELEKIVNDESRSDSEIKKAQEEIKKINENSVSLDKILAEVTEKNPNLKIKSEDGLVLDFSRATIRGVIENIKETHNRDKLISVMAQEYWDKFRGESAFKLSR